MTQSMSMVFVLLSILALGGCALVTVAVIAVVWAVMQERKQQ
jgi:hypothetical protein